MDLCALRNSAAELKFDINPGVRQRHLSGLDQGKQFKIVGCPGTDKT
jgi:hypothetical protein